ncbi:MAG: riboflavin synthase [Candidatus Omnitrophica bacterium]|nr:riboflavin synthase [Candidatus Omnitrophota bacterium]
MFTGIIEELGIVKSLLRKSNISLLEISCQKVLTDTKRGESIAVNGVCLTVVDKKQGSLSFEVIPETLRATNLAGLKINEVVNLERALKLGGRLSGHLVSGHIDCVGLLKDRYPDNGGFVFEIKIPLEFMNFIIRKGSVAVDGISLTVMDKKKDFFSLGITPHTLNNTTLKFKRPLDKLNIECDMLAKFARSVVQQL